MGGGKIPEMKHHKASGQGYVWLDGKRTYLGKFDSVDARAKYERAIAEWLSRDKTPRSVESGGRVAELLAAFMAHALAYYRDGDGEPTGEHRNYLDALRPVRRLYADLPAADFGPAELKAVRAAMVQSGLSRGVVNARVHKIRRVWKWAVAEGLMGVAVYSALQTVEPLLKHRTTAPESPGVAPVDEAVVRATLPHMPPAVAAMVELQLLTGCRVGEVLRMRGADIDRSVEPWEYRPARHKNEHRDQGRMIPLGPKARAIVRRFLGRDPDAFLFDPRAKATRADAKDRYDRRAYAQAIRRACDRAFPPPVISKIKLSRTVKLTPEQKAELAAWRVAHRWSPLQLRHTVGTRVRADHDLEAAQAVLGHARADATQIYAARLDGMARELAEEAG